jgi:UDPglucose 6-dehydrogenase
MMGAGYVGLVTGVCLAEMGSTVTCIDINEHKIKMLQTGMVPIYEPGLEHLIKKNSEQQNLIFSTSMDVVIGQADIVFIAVGTPMGKDGSANLTYVYDVAIEIGRKMTKDLIVVTKSTVPVGTTDQVRKIISEEMAQRKITLDFDVVNNPEFLKEGNAINDFMKPDRVVIGASRESSIELMKEIYAPFMRNHENFIVMDVLSSEMTKYAANAILATKISYMNEIANICERVGADVNQVRRGIGSDSRIGYHFIYPGCGYGGSCLPKDVQALIKTSHDFGYQAKFLEAVEEVNNYQKQLIVQKIVRRFGQDLSNMRFAVWGLSFKPETDDMRDASSITIINGLLRLGAYIQCYDPKAIKEAQEIYLKDYSGISYFTNKYDALNAADALILITEWKEFRSPDYYEMLQRLHQPIVFDGRNQYTQKRMLEYGFEYYQIGVGDSVSY